MQEATWLAALLLGLAGGAHCVGMCGGIVAAFSRAEAVRRGSLRFFLAYHGGRTLSYALAGAIVGALGQAGLALRGSGAAQHAAYAFASLALVLTGIYLAGYRPLAHRIEAAGQVLWRHIEPWSRSLLPVRTSLRALCLGMAWGWLPCGLVYGALLLALTSGSALAAASTMIAFALGTLPSLFVVGMVSRTALNRPVGPRMRCVAAAAVVLAGVYGLIHASLHAVALPVWCSLG